MPALTKNPDGSPHLHTYGRAFLKYNRVDPNRYRCIDPRCTHEAERKDLKGKLALCSICREAEIILTHERLKLSRPCCPACSGSKKDSLRKGILEGLAGLNLEEEGDE